MLATGVIPPGTASPATVVLVLAGTVVGIVPRGVAPAGVVPVPPPLLPVTAPLADGVGEDVGLVTLC